MHIDRRNLDANHSGFLRHIAITSPFSNPLLASLLSQSCSLRTFVPFFPDISVFLSREIRVAQRFSAPTLCHPFSPPSGLDSAIELQKRMPAAAARDSDGYNTLMFHDQLHSRGCRRLYGKLNYPGSFRAEINMSLAK